MAVLLDNTSVRARRLLEQPGIGIVMPEVPSRIEGKYHVSHSVLTEFYLDRQSVERDHDGEETAGPYVQF